MFAIHIFITFISVLPLASPNCQARCTKRS